MLYFVLHQHREMGKTYDNNVRMGGFRTLKGALNAAKKHAPSLVLNDSRKYIAGIGTDGSFQYSMEGVQSRIYG